jgi:hypothetical protein
MLRFNGRITDGRNIIGDLMDKNNMTSYKLGKAVGLNKNEGDRYRDGLMPRVETFIKILDFFGYDVEIKEKPDGIEGKTQQARDLGISYDELMARGM